MEGPEFKRPRSDADYPGVIRFFKDFWLRLPRDIQKLILSKYDITIEDLDVFCAQNDAFRKMCKETRLKQRFYEAQFRNIPHYTLEQVAEAQVLAMSENTTLFLPGSPEITMTYDKWGEFRLNLPPAQFSEQAFPPTQGDKKWHDDLPLQDYAEDQGELHYHEIWGEKKLTTQQVDAIFSAIPIAAEIFKRKKLLPFSDKPFDMIKFDGETSNAWIENTSIYKTFNEYIRDKKMHIVYDFFGDNDSLTQETWREYSRHFAREFFLILRFQLGMEIKENPSETIDGRCFTCSAIASLQCSMCSTPYCGEKCYTNKCCV